MIHTAHIRDAIARLTAVIGRDVNHPARIALEQLSVAALAAADLADAQHEDSAQFAPVIGHDCIICERLCRCCHRDADVCGCEIGEAEWETGVVAPDGARERWNGTVCRTHRSEL